MTDAAFWDRIAPKYAKNPISNPDAYEETLARTRAYLGPETRALELGCGTGTTALKLAPGTRRYVGTDISDGMIRIARGKPAEGAAAPEFRTAASVARAFADESFDTVLAFNLLHLVPDLEADLAAIHAHLPEGGLFISKTPALGGKWYFRPLIAAMRLIGKAPGTVRLISVDDLDRAVAAAGFRIVETGLYPPSTPSRFIVARKV
jgi:SAM-dependent methyltransferase